MNNSMLFTDDLNRLTTGFTITFKGNDKTMEFREVYDKFKSRSISSIEELRRTKKHMKVKFRLEITYVKKRQLNLMVKLHRN